MIRFYSVILLISLLVGTLQPILPMIEYQMQKGDLIELLGFWGNNTETGCQLTICGMEDDGAQQDEADQSLLDVDYYPLALEITSILNPDVFQNSTRCYLPSAKNIISPLFSPNSPPPRLS